MPSTARRLAAALALAIAIAALPAVAPAAPREPASPAARQAQVTRARLALLAERDRLGLGADAGFEARGAFTDEGGRTVARFTQTFRGHRVFGGESIVHLEPSGRLRTVTRGLQADAAPAGEPRLTADAAVRTALRLLAPHGPLARPPRAELVAFPSRLTGGLVVTRDPATGRPVVDRTASTWARPPAAPAVWAWEVSTLLMNREDGHREERFVVDAATGAVLRRWSALQHAAPATGTGRSYYRGEVALPTTQADDGTYTLISPAHGAVPNPFAAAQGETWLGLTTCLAWFHTDTGALEFTPYAGREANLWGDGTAFPPPWDPDFFQVVYELSVDGTRGWLNLADSPTGETAAVDAHAGLASTWDFYREVFGRDGIDGQGTSPIAVVHFLAQGFFGYSALWDNAFWSPELFGMAFGDGSRDLFQGGGMVAVTELDITGHELTHGVTQTTANLFYAGESGALNEATSDIFGKMVQAWVAGGGQGPAIPDFAEGDLAAWEIGHLSVPAGSAPLRFLYRPSLDGLSADAWYGGVDLLDVHFSSGVANRFFYFLAAGASADPASPAHSAYLPEGLAGIGNDRAARIWYRALTQYLTAHSDYAAAREASLEAARDLHGAGSPEEAAVMRAWAAVNVGEAPGEAPRVRVSMPVIHPAGSFLYDHAEPEAILERVQVFPTRTTVMVRADVRNTANKKVRIQAPTDASVPWPVGTVNADGTWTTPWWSYYADLIDLKAVSEADPRQFAMGRVLLMELDGDTDGEMDALDLGATAMEWGLPQAVHQPVNTAGSGTVSDWDLVFWAEAFQNGFPATAR